MIHDRWNRDWGHISGAELFVNNFNEDGWSVFWANFMTFLSDLKNEQMELKAQAQENSGWFSKLQNLSGTK